MSNEVQEIAGIKFKDAQAREDIKELKSGKNDSINIVEYTIEEDKTQAIEEIISQNKRVLIPNNETIKADNSCFIKEKFEKFIKNGKYITNTVANNTDNIIQERDISKCPHEIYRDMIFPSEMVNKIKWDHQKQSWLWQSLHWDMSKYASIVPWFQFSKNPEYNGEVPQTFNIYIGNFQVLAYDTTKNQWVEVYNGQIENCSFYNYYEGAEDNSSGSTLPYTWVGTYKKYSINYSDINTRVLHGWLGTSGDYISSNSKYKYVAFRLNAYTDAPHGYLTIGLGLDLKGGPTEKPIQEIAGSRSSLVTNESKNYYLSNVEPENYDKYLSKDTFNIIQTIKLDSINSNYITRGYIANNAKTYKLSTNSHYLVAITNLGSGNASSVQVGLISTGNSATNNSLVTSVVSGNIATVTVEGLTLNVEPKSGCYVNCSIIKL